MNIFKKLKNCLPKKIKTAIFTLVAIYTGSIYIVHVIESNIPITPLSVICYFVGALITIAAYYLVIYLVSSLIALLITSLRAKQKI